MGSVWDLALQVVIVELQTFRHPRLGKKAGKDVEPSASGLEKETQMTISLNSKVTHQDYSGEGTVVERYTGTKPDMRGRVKVVWDEGGWTWERSSELELVSHHDSQSEVATQ
ncbi:MAG: hypothetical protein ACAH17_01585 [Candidatus Paceibacterota bacterium]